MAPAEAYRPASLAGLGASLAELPPWTFVPPTDLLDVVPVGNDDTLSELAVKYYGDGHGRRWRDIHQANLDTIEDPDDIFPGQMVRIPRLGD